MLEANKRMGNGSCRRYREYFRLMAGKITSLGHRRMLKTNDARNWSPVEMLRKAIELIESGEIKPQQMVVHFSEGNVDDGVSFGYFVAGCAPPDHLVILDIARRLVQDAWMNDE